MFKAILVAFVVVRAVGKTIEQVVNRYMDDYEANHYVEHDEVVEDEEDVYILSASGERLYVEDFWEYHPVFGWSKKSNPYPEETPEWFSWNAAQGITMILVES